jgi:hypothetical protein
MGLTANAARPESMNASVRSGKRERIQIDRKRMLTRAHTLKSAFPGEGRDLG